MIFFMVDFGFMVSAFGKDFICWACLIQPVVWPLISITTASARISTGSGDAPRRRRSDVAFVADGESVVVDDGHGMSALRRRCP